MANGVFIADTPSSIAFVQLCSIKGAVSLECKGMKHSSGRSACAMAKQKYGLRGNKARVLAQLQEMVNKAILDSQRVETLATQ